MNIFLSDEDIVVLTGIKSGRAGKTRGQRQADQLRKMNIPFWINAAGRAVVTRAAIEGRPEADQIAGWVPKPLRYAA